MDKNVQLLEVRRKQKTTVTKSTTKFKCEYIRYKIDTPILIGPFLIQREEKG